jgi:AbiV family abortive infection protein
VLSVLALEEFGKFLIYNDLAWHKSVGEGDVPPEYVKMHKQYLKESLSNHTRKIQHVISWHFGPMLKKSFEKNLEKLSSERLSALYVGVNQKNGHVILPKKFSKKKARSQMKLMNDKILLECAREVKRKNWHFDTDQMNRLITKNLNKLEEISKKLN